MSNIEPTEEQRAAVNQFMVACDYEVSTYALENFTAEREHALRAWADGNVGALEMACLEIEKLEAHVATLTKQRDEARLLVDMQHRRIEDDRNSERMLLADIATLRDACEKMYDAQEGPRGVDWARLESALAATAHYAKPSKEATEVCAHCTERTTPFFDDAAGGWLCDRCHHPVPSKDGER